MTQSAPLQRHLHLGSAEVIGQPPPDGSVPLVTTEYGESPAFDQLVREQADLFRRGLIGIDNFGDFMEVANLVSRTDYGDREEYTDRDGRILTGADAENAAQLYAAGTPEFWTLGRTTAPGQQVRPPDEGEQQGPEQDRPLTHAQLSVVATVFKGYGGIANEDLQGSEETLRQLEIARRRAASTLGITEPESLTLDELREAIERRQQLSDVITDDRGFREQHFLPGVLRHYNAAHGIAESSDAMPRVEPAAASDASQTTMIMSRPMQAPAPPDESPILTDPQVITSSSRRIRSHRRDPSTDPEHISNRRHTWATIGAVVLSVAVTTALRAADVVPGGSLVVGATVGAVGATVGAITNKRFWVEKSGRQKLGTLALAVGGGAVLGAGVALGTTLLMDAIPDAIDKLHDLFSSDVGATAPDPPVTTPDPNISPDPTPPTQPPPPAAFDGPLQTEQFGEFTGADGGDANPWLEGTGYDAAADRIETEFRLATGQPLDWSAIDPQAYHGFVGQVLEQNGKTWADMAVAPDGTSLTIDPQKALSFLSSQLNIDLSAAGAKA